VVERVEQPETGGMFTKYLGCNYLYKGFPDRDIIHYIYSSKRVIAGLFPLFLNKSVRFLFGITFFFYLLLPRQMKKKAIIGLLDYFLRITHYIEFEHPYASPTEKYCKAVQEVHRISVFILSDYPETEILERIKKIRDIVCMILEFDYAYRARLQDILPLLDKEGLQEKRLKECLIYSLREKQSMVTML
jgi:hypothetical protein